MIEYLTVGWKNFLGTGNDGVEIDLTAAPVTLIKGLNGSGKSTMIDALSFGLYGKPYRDVNKNQLINSINGKGTLVWVTLRQHGKVYTVKRGIKPDLFEIYCDDVLLEHKGAVAYQKDFETKVLNSSHKTFCQVDVLGSARYVPFMSLKTDVRRTVVEDLLGISIFTTMATIGKEHLSTLNMEYRDLQNTASHKTMLLEMYNRQELAIVSDNADKIKQLQQKLDDVAKEIVDATQLLAKNNQEIEQLKSKLTHQSRLDQLIREKEDQVRSARQAITIVQRDQSIIHATTCVTCKQEITEQHKHSVQQEIDRQVAQHTQLITAAEQDLVKLNTKKAEYTAIDNQIRALTNNNNTINMAIATAKAYQTSYKQNIDDLSNSPIQKSNADEVEQVKKDVFDTNSSMEAKAVQIQDATLAMSLLKDDGLKASIIATYIPKFNQFINKYLETLDFFCYFELDQEFNESIKSRYRDNFTYESFSEGEKMRINLAILFAWRQIALIRNSVSSNLLIMDETFDSSLDIVGFDNLVKLIDTIDINHIFVISHSDAAVDRVGRIIDVNMKENFSRYKLRE